MPEQMGGSQNQGYHFEGPHNKDYNILGSIWGSHYLGKLPNITRAVAFRSIDKKILLGTDPVACGGKRTR